MNALDYLLKTNLYLLLFYSCYWLFLRHTTFFALNRAYLLASVVVSLLLPLAKLPSQAADVLPMDTVTLPAFAVGAATEQPTDSWSTLTFLPCLYAAGVVFMLLRLGGQLWSVFQLIDRGRVEKQAAYTLVYLLNDTVPSFSFGRYLVLNQTDTITQPDALLAHEEAHIRQYHTADVLFIELVRAALWFNPVLTFYKRSLQQVHEYLADRAASGRVASGSVVNQPDYARLLVSYALDIPTAALTTPFVSFSNLKQRIQMLQKPASNRRALLSYVVALPLAAMLAMCTQAERDLEAEHVAAVNLSSRIAGVDGEIFMVVEQQPEFPGGMEGLSEYLAQSIHYPAAAQRAEVQGRVFVNFVVTKEGDITDVKILKGIGFGTDEEAVRVVKQMPRWKPGYQSNQPVNVRFNLPINFQLDDEDDKLSKQDALKDVKHFLINGKQVTKEEFTALPAESIGRVDVNRKEGVIAITTK